MKRLLQDAIALKAQLTTDDYLHGNEKASALEAQPDILLKT